LIAVLLLLVLGFLVIPPLLGLMSTGLTAGKMHEERAQRYYAADAGVEDALWQIKNDRLADLFTDYDLYAYSDYDPSYKWDYTLAGDVNAKVVNATIENVWIPKDIDAPKPDDGREIIESAKLVVTGSVIGESQYQIKITYNYDGEEDPNGQNLEVDAIGIWLPPGFSYVADSSNLEDDDELDPPYLCEPTTEAYKSGQAVVWDFGDGALFMNFPGVNPSGYPLVASITFNFASSPGTSPGAALSWITTEEVPEVPFAWDADVQVYKISSVATDPTTAKQTTVEAYTAKTELRKLGSTIPGDYRATGNSLMVDTNYDSYGIRDELLPESDAVVGDIPTDAEVAAAYLYWSAWLAESSGQTLFLDNCSSMANWSQSGNDWVPDSGRFRGHHVGGEQDRYLTIVQALDLSSYVAGTVTVSWDQSIYYYWYVDPTDGLQFEFSADGGSTWGGLIPAFYGNNPEPSFSYVIPLDYLSSSFKMRFRLDGFSSSYEYVYIDNIRISVQTGTIADNSVRFEIDGVQVYFDGDGNPQAGDQEIVAAVADCQVLPNYDSYGNPNGYSYACKKDVTELVRTFTTPGAGGNYPGNATYLVGGVNGDTGNQWSYAGWSLIIIYSSTETKGHQLYLYDDFLYAHNDTNIDFDDDGEDGGAITGFIVPDPVEGEVNAAKITCFVGEGDDVWNGDSFQVNSTKLWDGTEGESLNDVWNGQSLGMSADGVDIDTFYVTWDSGLLESGDTLAQVDLPTLDDSWNLVYIILSFRSETFTGGTLSYLIGG
jgi:hypothetical protein